MKIIKNKKVLKAKVNKIRKGFFGASKGVGSLKKHERFSHFDWPIHVLALLRSFFI